MRCHPPSGQQPQATQAAGVNNPCVLPLPRLQRHDKQWSHTKAPTHAGCQPTVPCRSSPHTRTPVSLHLYVPLLWYGPGPWGRSLTVHPAFPWPCVSNPAGTRPGRSPSVRCCCTGARTAARALMSSDYDCTVVSARSAWSARRWDDIMID